MENTIADNRQLFNVKAIETAGKTVEQIADNTLGVIDVSTGLTVVPANFGAFPAEAQFVANVNGIKYFGVDNIVKEDIIAKNAHDYVPAVGEEWETVIQCCKCIDAIQLNIGVTNGALLGSTATPAYDFVYEIAPQELKCRCACDGSNKELENNEFTRLIVNKINGSNSEFYGAKASIPTDGIDTGSTLPSSNEEEGDLYIKSGANEGLYIYDGTQWVLVGDSSGDITDIETYVDAMFANNTDSDPDNHGPMMTLIIYGKVLPTPHYSDLEPNYIYPRGTKLTVAFNSDINGCAPTFTKTQDLVYEIGAGYDLRAEEFENMSHYTNLNRHPQLCDGLKDARVIYQFENGVNYKTVNVEFQTKKTLRNTGAKKSFNFLLGTSDNTVWGTLKTMFGL